MSFWYSYTMNFGILILVAVVIVIIFVVVIIIGSDTGSDDEEGYDVADDKDDAHYDPSSGTMR
jgi:hypothetical protein